MEKNNPLGVVLGLLCWAYGIMSQIMSLVFFVRYCKTDSLLEIIFIDTWLSELKGIFWIFFIQGDYLFKLYILYIIGAKIIRKQ